jgi:hypothetical protein
MKVLPLIGALFVLLLFAGPSVGGEPVSTAVPNDVTIISSDRLDDVDDILEENELSGKKAKPYCENGFNTWEIKITKGKISGTFYPWNGGSYPVTGTKNKKHINMIATGLCDIYCNTSHELDLNKSGKGTYSGSFQLISCPDQSCDASGSSTLVKGGCN